MNHNLITRRQMLLRAGGYATVGLTGALHASHFISNANAAPSSPIPHFAPKAKQVIFLLQNGAPSHVDTFDPKPALKKREGEKPDFKLARKSKAGGYMPSPFKFAPHGKSGLVMSELLPNLANIADDLCVLRSMHTDEPNHEPGLLMMLSGNQQPIRPSIGSWVSYGLGAINQNLPTYVNISPGMPVVGPQLWSNGFLPGRHQGTSVDTNNTKVEKLIANLRNPNLKPNDQRKQVDLIQLLNRLHLESRSHDPALESQIRAMELAFNMQAEASDAFDINREPETVHNTYGRSLYGRSCLLARRLIERGVRYISVHYVKKGSKQPWDTHKNNNKQHRTLCADSDQATAALLVDLKQRGLLDETLVIWGGEFGRTPFAEKAKNKTQAGRDHHATGFSMFLAGGGVKGGFTHGATDEFGMHAVEDRVHVHDLHATILHLLGLNHEKLTYRYSGRDFRLTDVHGKVVSNIIA